jgi:hypothetical protein
VGASERPSPDPPLPRHRCPPWSLCVDWIRAGAGRERAEKQAEKQRRQHRRANVRKRRAKEGAGGGRRGKHATEGESCVNTREKLGGVLGRRSGVDPRAAF